MEFADSVRLATVNAPTLVPGAMCPPALIVTNHAPPIAPEPPTVASRGDGHRPAPRAEPLALAAMSEPASTFVPPAYVLLPLNVSFPAASLVTDPAPEIEPPK
jgi:hypothetical protein